MLSNGIGIGVVFRTVLNGVGGLKYTINLLLQTALTALKGTAPTLTKASVTYAPSCAAADADSVTLATIPAGVPHVVSEQAASGYAPRFDTNTWYDTLADSTPLHPTDADGKYLRYSAWSSGAAVTAGDYCHYLGSYYKATANDAVNTDTPDVATNWVSQGYYRGPFFVRTFQATSNYLANPATPATQTTGSLAIGSYILWQEGTGSSALTAGTATLSTTGTATDGSPVLFNVTGAGTVTVTVTGTPTRFNLTGGSAKLPFIASVATQNASYLTAVGTEIGEQFRLEVLPLESGRQQTILGDGTRSLFHDGTNLVYQDKSGVMTGGELVVNGTNPTTTTGWTTEAGLPILSADGTKFTLTSDGTGNYAYQLVPVSIGKKYRVRGKCKNGTSTANFRAGTSAAGTEYFNSQSASSEAVADNIITATSANLYIAFVNSSPAAGANATYYDTSVLEVLELSAPVTLAAGDKIGVKTKAGAAALAVNGVDVDTETGNASASTWDATTYLGKDSAGSYVLNGGVPILQSISNPSATWYKEG